MRYLVFYELICYFMQYLSKSSYGGSLFYKGINVGDTKREKCELWHQLFAHLLCISKNTEKSLNGLGGTY